MRVVRYLSITSPYLSVARLETQLEHNCRTAGLIRKLELRIEQILNTERGGLPYGSHTTDSIQCNTMDNCPARSIPTRNAGELIRTNKHY